MGNRCRRATVPLSPKAPLERDHPTDTATGPAIGLGPVVSRGLRHRRTRGTRSVLDSIPDTSDSDRDMWVDVHFRPDTVELYGCWELELESEHNGWLVLSVSTLLRPPDGRSTRLPPTVGFRGGTGGDLHSGIVGHQIGYRRSGRPTVGATIRGTRRVLPVVRVGTGDRSSSGIPVAWSPPATAPTVAVSGRNDRSGATVSVTTTVPRVTMQAYIPYGPRGPKTPLSPVLSPAERSSSELLADVGGRRAGRPGRVRGPRSGPGGPLSRASLPAPRRGVRTRPQGRPPGRSRPSRDGGGCGAKLLEPVP
jgi:hypothetical protein